MAGYFIRTKSQIDGKPIILSFTDRTTNKKVGNIIQTWIMRERINPYHAILTGGDSSVCGECPRRHFTGGDCYVSMKRGPAAVWDSVRERRANALDLDNPPKRLIGRVLRMGAYGDPVAVPMKVWRDVFSALKVTHHLGYTHQWRDPQFSEFKTLLMASCDSESDRKQASRAGWRTFRVRGANDPVLNGEFICPASSESPKIGITCQACRLCDGTNTRAKDPVIIAHGFRNRKGNAALRIGSGVAEVWK